MKKFRAAVVGYGNIGKFTVEALEAAPDFEIAGIVRRQGAKDKPAELADYEVVDDITKLKDVDVAILLPLLVLVQNTLRRLLPSASTQWIASTSTPAFSTIAPSRWKTARRLAR